MRVKNRTTEENEEDFNPFNYLLLNKIESGEGPAKADFVKKYLNGVDYFNGCREN